MGCLAVALQNFAGWTLCLFYSAQIVLLIVVKFFTKPHSKFWVVKKRPYPPQCLQKHDYGVNKYVTVNGVKLHYVESGDPSRPLMLFVHGFPEFWFSWRHQLKEFSKDYWVIAVDMRGYGDSEKPKGQQPYKIQQLVKDVKELVETLGRSKFTLVAHDWGAVIGWDFIQQHMDMVDKYIMMGGASRWAMRKTIMTNKKQFKMSWYTFFFKMPKLPEFFIRMNDFRMFDKVFGKHCSPEEVEAFKYTFAKKGALTEPINYYRANLRASSEPVSAVIPKDVPHAPGLFLLGEKDIYISKETGPLMEQKFNNLEFMVAKGVDHFLQQDDPALVNRLMREFLERK